MFAPLRRVVLLTCVLLPSAIAAGAQTRVQIVHYLNDGPLYPSRAVAGLIVGADGAFYGTTQARNGEYQTEGTVYRMTTSGAVTVLHKFAGGAADGALVTTGLVQAADGAFYGTTQRGGVSNLGVVYRVTAVGAFTVLHSFAGGLLDGAAPLARLIQARNGYLYGTTTGGGAYGLGTAFRISTSGEFTLLHSFAGEPTEGASPEQPLVEGQDGNFYGSTTLWTYTPTNGGTIFRMTPAGAVTVLHRLINFVPDGIWPLEGMSPAGGLMEATDGSFYGTTREGGEGSFGTIFRITADGVFSKLHAFAIPYAVWSHPGDLIQAADGAVYGTYAWHGYAYGDELGNTVFSITPDGIYTTLTKFRGFVGDGAPLVQAPDGWLYGTLAESQYWDPGPAIFRLTRQPVNGFDDDIAADLPVYDRATGRWRILTSSSGYRAATQFNWGGAGYSPVPADYDGDGRCDIAVYRASSGVWSILKSGSDFTAVISLAWGGVGYIPVPGDYDGDQKADLTVYRPATGQWHILHSNSDFSSASTFVFGDRGAVPVGGDYDGDGIADLALYRPATGTWDILTSRSGFTASLTKTLGGPGYMPVPGDYDGDSITDIAVYAQAHGTWLVLRSSSDFTTTWTQDWGGSGYSPVPGDYDRDGRNDLAVYNATLGEWFVLQSTSNFTTTLRAVFGEPGETVLAGPVRLSWTDASRATDYDGDGASDLAVYEPSSGAWSIRDSSANFTATRTIAWGAAGDIPVPGDYDGDGRTDVATFNDTSGLWSARLTSGPTLTAILGNAGDIPLPRDYDGDLVTDLAVYTPSTGVWRLLLSSTGFTATTTITWGGAGWTPVPGDYDGDGKADLGLYQQTQPGRWQILLAAANYTTQQTAAWGGSAYTAVPGDYDGDGKFDFAVCAKSTGQWYVLKSGFTYTTAFGLPWGAAIDTPLSADYDGDGIADMVSYDSTTGAWQVRLSSSYFTLLITRTLGGTGFILPR